MSPISRTLRRSIQSITLGKALFTAHALIALTGAGAAWAGDGARGNKDVKVETTVVTLDPSLPASCEQFHHFVESKKLETGDSHVREDLDNRICHPKGSNQLITLVLMQQKEAEADDAAAGQKNHVSIEINAGGEYHGGNENFIHLNGDLKFEEHWRKRHLFRVTSAIEYESDSEVSRAVAAAEYLYDLNNHFALFGIVSPKHDRARELNVGTSEFVGALYNIFPFQDKPDQMLIVSAGVGHRFDRFSDGFTRNDLVASYRVMFEANLMHQLKLMTAIWFQHRLATMSTGDILGQPVSSSDFRVLFQLKLEVGDTDKPGFHASFGLEDEYWTDPRPGTQSNDVRIVAGLGYSWKN